MKAAFHVGCVLLFCVSAVAAGFLWIEEHPNAMTWTWRIVCSCAALVSLVIAAAMSWRAPPPPAPTPADAGPTLEEFMASDMAAMERLGARIALGFVSCC
jgi:hypothetical protein